MHKACVFEIHNKEFSVEKLQANTTLNMRQIDVYWLFKKAYIWVHVRNLLLNVDPNISTFVSQDLI